MFKTKYLSGLHLMGSSLHILKNLTLQRCFTKYTLVSHETFFTIKTTVQHFDNSHIISLHMNALL
jgi:hypothetical protein